MNTFMLTMRQVRYVNKSFWRNPTRAFFSFAFPLLFLVIFTSLLHGTLMIGHLQVKASTYYVAAMAAFGVIAACFNNVALAITAQREAGILKRANGTPLPGISFIAARILHSVVVAVILVAITAILGRAVYSARIPGGIDLVEFLLVLVIGAAAFSALALALSAFIPNADAALPIINAVILPLLFLSGIFIAFGNTTPSWLLWIARIFPIKHFAAGMQAAFIGTPFDWTDVIILAAWGIAGLLIALRYFSWEPHSK